MSEAKPFETTCPKCGAAKVEGERYCPNCGHDLFALEPEPGTRSKDSGQMPPRRHKSIGLTIILAIIFPGLGHLYAGRWARGLTIMLGFIVVLFVIGEMLWVPTSQSIVAGLAPADLRGAYMGAFGGTGAAGFALAPFVGLQVRGAAGDLAMWAVFALVSVVAVVLGVIAVRGAGARRADEGTSAVLGA